MISFLLVLAVVCMIVRWTSALGCPAPRGRWALHGHDSESQRNARTVSRAGAAAPAALRSPATRVETPLEKLQRQFSTGEITVEQYEHEVGKLYGVREERSLEP
ncbi:MAG: hypothetical protein L0271_04830 [Gemmatimonadetes bacterium]|nr:hypothetical protein [Gemmatimonadota bacterium]